jgi:hypothetical protein
LSIRRVVTDIASSIRKQRAGKPSRRASLSVVQSNGVASSKREAARQAGSRYWTVCRTRRPDCSYRLTPWHAPHDAIKGVVVQAGVTQVWYAMLYTDAASSKPSRLGQSTRDLRTLVWDRADTSGEVCMNVGEVETSVETV